MIPFLKKYWLVVIFVAAGLFFFLSGWFDSCSFSRSEAVIEAVDEAKLRRHLIDSITTVNAATELRRIDSVQKAGQNKVAALKKQISKLENERDGLIADFVADTSAQPDDCAPIIALADSALKKSVQVADSLKAQVTIQEDLTKKEQEKAQQFRALYLFERNNYESSEADVERLKKQLAKEMTWWRKNEKWFFAGGAAALMFLIAK